MRRISVITMFGLIISLSLYAKKIEGKIFFENDTIDVTFILPVDLLTQDIIYENVQQKIKYIDRNGIKHKLRPDDAKEIRFKYPYSEIRMISVPNNLGLGNPFFFGQNIFLELKIDGYLKLFNYYYKQKSANMFTGSSGFNNSINTMNTYQFEYTVERFILQKGNGGLKRPKRISFKKDMIEYFQDCPELVEKFENKEINKDYLESAVRFYNSRCANK
jgi:hypothetical protein